MRQVQFRRVMMAITVGAAMLAARSAFAASLVINNFSFESPVVDPLQQASPGADGWNTDNDFATMSFNAGIFPNSPMGQPGHLDNVDGNQVAFLGAGSHEFTQALPYVWMPGAYQITVGVAKSLFVPPDPTATLRLRLYWVDDANMRQYILDKLVTPADVANDSIADFSQGIVLDPAPPGPTMPFGRTVNIELSTGSVVGGFFDLDNVRVTGPVPEPASLGLLTLGAIAILRRRR